MGKYQEKERVWGNVNAEQHDLTRIHRIFTVFKLFALHKIVCDCFLAHLAMGKRPSSVR